MALDVGSTVKFHWSSPACRVHSGKIVERLCPRFLLRQAQVLVSSRPSSAHQSMAAHGRTPCAAHLAGIGPHHGVDGEVTVHQGVVEPPAAQEALLFVGTVRPT